MIFSESLVGAMQRPGFHIGYGPYLYKSVFESSFSNTMDNYHLGFSIIGEAMSADFGSLEASISFLEKYYYRETADSFVIDKIPRVHIGLGYRYWFWEYFSFGFELSTSYSMGSKENVKSFGLGSSGIETSANDITEYLLDGSFQAKLWTNKDASYYLDFRYSKLLTGRASEKGNHLGVIFLYKQHLSQVGAK